MRKPLAQWTPDLFGLANPNSFDAKNVIASGAGYTPVNSLQALSITPMDGMALGAISALDTSGVATTFSGDSTKLYQLVAGEFGNVSKSGNYSVGSGERWEFAAYGSRIIAVQPAEAVQYFDMGSSTLFDDLAGSPPQARHVAVIRDFLVLGNTANGRNDVTWSGIGDSEQWTAAVEQSDTQTLVGGGQVQKIIGGEVGFIFQERAITRMSYSSPPTYFQFDLVEDARGLLASGAIVRVGGLIYFLSQDGFYTFSGVGSTPIGNQKVDDWFAAHLEPSTLSQITCAADPTNKIVVWSFVSTDATDTSKPDTLLIYNWQNAQWSYAKMAHEMLFQALSAGMTLEQLGAQFTSIETVPETLDSSRWAGGMAFLGAFGTDHNISSFSGATLAATVETGDFEAIPERRSLITSITPLTDAVSVMGVCRSREKLADSTTDTASTVMEANGEIALISSGQYHRIQLNIPAGATWTYVNGVDVEAQDDGWL